MAFHYHKNVRIYQLMMLFPYNIAIPIPMERYGANGMCASLCTLPVISRKSINTQNCITNNQITNKMLRDMNGLQQLKIHKFERSAI